MVIKKEQMKTWAHHFSHITRYEGIFSHPNTKSGRESRGSPSAKLLGGRLQEAAQYYLYKTSKHLVPLNLYFRIPLFGDNAK